MTHTEKVLLTVSLIDTLVNMTLIGLGACLYKRVQKLERKAL